MGLEAVVIETNEDEVRGINTKAQLAEAESVMQARLRKAALCHSACNIDPLMEWAPRGGQDQASGLTVRRACCFKLYRADIAKS